MAINKTPIFVAKTRNYNIFVAKIYDYALIDSPTSYATLAKGKSGCSKVAKQKPQSD